MSKTPSPPDRLFLASTILIFWTIWSCGPGPSPAPSAAEDLRRVARELYADSPYYGRAERERLEKGLENPTLSPPQRLQLRIALATELLEAGEMEPALELAEENHAQGGAGDPRLARVAVHFFSRTRM